MNGSPVGKDEVLALTCTSKYSNAHFVWTIEIKYSHSSKALVGYDML